MGFVMTYAALVEFLETKMSMSHIYQPLLIRALVDAGGATTLRQLVQDFLSRDSKHLAWSSVHPATKSWSHSPTS